MKNLPSLVGAFGLAAMASVLAACGGSFPPPTDRLASAEAASRSARELGADRDPKAQLHLKLAQEQIDQAKTLIADGDNKRADLVLQRANSDAELSVMLAKETTAKGEAEKAQDRVKSLKGGK
jgi:Flp pilus assembly protein TadD